MFGLVFAIAQPPVSIDGGNSGDGKAVVRNEGRSLPGEGNDGIGNTLQNRLQNRIGEIVEELRSAKEWMRASEKRWITEVFRRLVDEFGKGNHLEIASALMEAFPESVEVIARIAVGHDPANAVKIAIRLNREATKMGISGAMRRQLVAGIAETVPFHRHRIELLGIEAAWPRDKGASGVSSLRESGGEISTGVAPAVDGPLDESAAEAEVSLPERSFRLPNASTARFHTSGR